MSSSTNNVVLTLLFEDESTRIYTFEDVSDDVLGNIKAKIFDINDNANNAYENFYKTFVSRDGAAFSRISACKIVTIEEEVIYGG